MNQVSNYKKNSTTIIFASDGSIYTGIRPHHVSMTSNKIGNQRGN